MITAMQALSAIIDIPDPVRRRSAFREWEERCCATITSALDVDRVHLRAARDPDTCLRAYEREAVGRMLSALPARVSRESAGSDVDLDEDVARRLREAADERGVSVAEQLREVVEAWAPLPCQHLWWPVGDRKRCSQCGAVRIDGPGGTVVEVPGPRRR